MTSNPSFAFHDDVFPFFLKGVAFQPKFPGISWNPVNRLPPKTIVPDLPFSGLEATEHISTFEINKTFSLNLDIKVSVEQSNFNKDIKINRL